MKQESFVGKWTITGVSCDGAAKTEWVGKHLTISQTKTNGGLYSMSDTKYDSIWSANGTWTKSTSQSVLILDNTLPANFAVEKDRLIITKLLSWTGQSTCEDGICLPDVTGNWNFIFERQK